MSILAGRAGNKGTAITFIGPEEDQYAGDLVKALKESKAPIPEDLINMAKEHADKVKRGEAKHHGSGYGGSGFKFDTAEEDQEHAKKKVCTDAVPWFEYAVHICACCSGCTCGVCVCSTPTAQLLLRNAVCICNASEFCMRDMHKLFMT